MFFFWKIFVKVFTLILFKCKCKKRTKVKKGEGGEGRVGVKSRKLKIGCLSARGI